MERKILITGIVGIIVLLIVLVPIGIGHDYGFKWLFNRTEAETPAKTPEELEMEKTLEMEKLQKVISLTDSEEFLGGFSVDGAVEEIFESALVIRKSNEKGEGILGVVPIGKDAQITCGGKEISFPEIKVGDEVFVLLNQIEVLLSNCPLEGVYVDVSVPETDLADVR